MWSLELQVKPCLPSQMTQEKEKTKGWGNAEEERFGEGDLKQALNSLLSPQHKYIYIFDIHRERTFLKTIQC